MLNNNLKTINNVKKVIMIASGKGGVGKSTTTLNMGLSLVNNGYKVGIIDADIYGSSITYFINQNKQRVTFNENKTINPIISEDIKFISITHFLDKGNNAIIWRGPMLSKFIREMFDNVEWGKLDFLLIDTPPGTGDIHITIMKEYHIDGCVLITTPNIISTIGMNKTKNMLDLFSINALGIIENLIMDDLKVSKNTENFMVDHNIKNVSTIPYLKEISNMNEMNVTYDKKIIQLYYDSIIKQMML